MFHFVITLGTINQQNNSAGQEPSDLKIMLLILQVIEDLIKTGSKPSYSVNQPGEIDFFVNFSYFFFAETLTQLEY